MRIFGVDIIASKEITRLREENSVYARTLEDIGWNNLSLDTSQKDIFPQGFKKVLSECKKFFYLNPLAGHWVHLTTDFVFGEGISAPKCENELVQAEIDSFWNDPDNAMALTSYSSQKFLSDKLQYEGNLFFVLFTDTVGNVRVRVLNAAEVGDIINDDEDRMRVNFYKVANVKRKYNFASDGFDVGNVEFIYYPDVSNINLGDFGVPASKLVDASILHIKVNCDINDKFGVPELYRGIDWIRAHKNMAEDMATLVKSLSTLAWKKKIKGTPAQVAALRAAAHSKADFSNRNPSAGSTQYENEGVDTTPINTPTGGVVIGEKGMRQLKLMVCAASGIFEHYFGDPSTGNLATAYSMELPMVKKFSSYQQLHQGIYKSILMHQINKKIELGILPLGSVEYDAKTRRNKVVYNEPIIIDADFPPIVDKDPKVTAEALKIGKDARLIGNESAARVFLSALKINNIDQEIKDIDFTPPTVVPFGQPQSTPVEKIKPEVPIKEAVSKPDVKAAARLAKKNNYLLSRMEAYRKALSHNFGLLKSTVKRGAKIAGESGRMVGDIPNLVEALVTFKENMLTAAEEHFPIAVDIGAKFTQSHLKNAMLKEAKKSTNLNGLLSQKLDWNRKYVTSSLVPDLKESIDKALKSSYITEKEFAKAIDESMNAFDGRVEQYVGAFWNVEEAAVKEAGAGTGLMVNFVGADDDSTCEGCNEAMAGNPYPIEDAPQPGDHECHGNCRHALQILEEAVA